YPNYPQLIPSETQFVTTLTIDRKTLIKSIEKVGAVLDEKSQKLISIEFDYDNQQIKLAAETQSVGKCFEMLTVQISGADLDSVGFNSNYLLDGLKNMDCTEIQMKLSGKTNPCIVNPLSNLDMIYLIMPVQIRKV
ncbi:MAG TPA: DNA polymerase III subunit beta, partial [Allocoleopsis sp.]